jgi:hypothetical protein
LDEDIYKILGVVFMLTILVNFYFFLLSKQPNLRSRILQELMVPELPEKLRPSYRTLRVIIAFTRSFPLFLS